MNNGINRNREIDILCLELINHISVTSTNVYVQLVTIEMSRRKSFFWSEIIFQNEGVEKAIVIYFVLLLATELTLRPQNHFIMS